MFLEKPSCLLRTGKPKGFERRWRPLPGKFKNRGPRNQSAGSEQWTPMTAGGGSGDLCGAPAPGRAASPLGTKRRGMRSTRRGQRAASAGARGGGGRFSHRRPESSRFPRRRTRRPRPRAAGRRAQTPGGEQDAPGKLRPRTRAAGRLDPARAHGSPRRAAGGGPRGAPTARCSGWQTEGARGSFS